MTMQKTIMSSIFGFLIFYCVSLYSIIAFSIITNYFSLQITDSVMNLLMILFPFFGSLTGLSSAGIYKIYDQNLAIIFSYIISSSIGTIGLVAAHGILKEKKWAHVLTLSLMLIVSILGITTIVLAQRIDLFFIIPLVGPSLIVYYLHKSKAK